MWLKLGEEELVNLNHCTAIKKGEELTIELCYANPSQDRIISFEREEERDLAFERVVKNLIRMQKAME